MDAIVAALIGVGAEIFKMTIRPVVRQFRYCTRYKKYTERLAQEVDYLKQTRMDVDQKVERAKRNLEFIMPPVEAWLVKVENEINQYQGNLHLYVRNAEVFQIPYIGKGAFKKIRLIDELITEGKSFKSVIDEGKNFGNVSDFFPSLDVMPTIDQDIVDLPSREFTKNQVMAALKDEDTYSVGIYGMGGIGKTTLMKQVWKQVREENVFDAVVMITVSENADVGKIQVDIANQLGLTRLLEVSEEWKRSIMLSRRLKQENRILVILEDLWTDFNLSCSVGIPCGRNNSNVCKVAITATDVEVCQKFKLNNPSTNQTNIEVRVLSREDSMHLFMKNVSEVVDSPDLRKAATDIVEECNGLPLALVTLGRAMINKGIPVWTSTASHLKRSNLTMLRETLSKVAASFEQSYHHLENNILKKCFLFCCLFHKNCQIDIDQLVMYVMSDETIVADLETLNEVRGRVQTVLDKLINSCLILSYTKKNNGIVSSVTMHGIVRDVGIKIALEEKNGFFVSTDADSSTWPQREISKMRNCLGVSLMKNKISMLPQKPELPGLLVLSLQQNHPLKRIPDGFFSSMDALVSLDISKTGISSLPSSLSFLVNLKSLCLDCCDFRGPTNLSVLGSLMKLEILSLFECCLSTLPNEIGELRNLKSLVYLIIMISAFHQM
ncbi:hypothetical protein MKW94_003974 [Papaver nudicaule]|uniref:NB-ARC domain-containing protein n=1 Tax=Papaver nudicaule TaxID=74823 RepID=A0AA41SHX8_PAPNU|nr:hypothetical protein [Papaver nudicaule]